ncbi:hypothetical protein HOY80DRAFT_1098652 [Tuber brumale]|nr:hypothetical protein HOY80DRAFT_1098652 [Tuber brumale]
MSSKTPTGTTKLQPRQPTSLPYIHPNDSASIAGSPNTPLTTTVGAHSHSGDDPSVELESKRTGKVILCCICHFLFFLHLPDSGQEWLIVDELPSLPTATSAVPLEVPTYPSAMGSATMGSGACKDAITTGSATPAIPSSVPKGTKAVKQSSHALRTGLPGLSTPSSPTAEISSTGLRELSGSSPPHRTLTTNSVDVEEITVEVTASR